MRTIKEIKKRISDTKKILKEYQLNYKDKIVLKEDIECLKWVLNAEDD